MNKKEIAFVCCCFLLAFLLRSYLLPYNLFFGPEQGIDFLVIKSIVLLHKVTLIGAKTDIRGIFHGPLYYYIASIPFFFSGGNPTVISFFLIFIHSLSVVPLYLLGRKMFSKKVAGIATLLFVVSFEAIVGARWLSGQPLAMFFVCLFLYYFYRFVQGEDKALLLLAIFFGMVAQLEFLNFLFLGFFLTCCAIVFFKRVNSTNKIIMLASIVLGIGISIGSFILFDIRHQFLILKSIIGIFTTPHGFFSVSYGETLLTTLQTNMYVLSRSLFPLWDLSGIVFLLGIFIFLFYIIMKKSKENTIAKIFLLYFLSPTVVLFLLHQSVLEHFLLIFIPAFCLIFAWMIDVLWEKNKLISSSVFGLIFCVNILTVLIFLPQNKNVFFQSTQPFFSYGDEVKTIRTIYQREGKRQFAFQAYTIPYWKQEGWEYLFWYFGSSTFGNIPHPITHDKLYVIVQHDPAPFQKIWLQHTVPLWGEITGKFTYGDIMTLILKVKNT